MNVGVVYLGRRGPGGPISLELATHLSSITPTFAVVSADGDHLELWRKSGIDLIVAPTFKSDFEAFGSLFLRRPIRALADRIRAQKPDALIYPMVHPWTPLLQRYLRPIPDVVTVHDAVPHPGLKHQASSLWERRAARGASRCVVLSSRFVDELSRKGVDRRKIDVIPHGIFTFYRRGESSGIPSGAPGPVLFFGRITAYKGLDILLRAFAPLSARRPGLRLQIVGSGDASPFSDLLKNLPNVEVINRWVSDDEVAGFFENASFVVLPYTSASQSGVAPLAASFGKTVIATKVGALPDQIQHGESGLLVNPNSVEELAAAMEMLLDQPDTARRMGERLAEQTRETGNWDSIATAFLESCRRAAAAP